MSAWIVSKDQIDLLVTYIGTESPVRELLPENLRILTQEQLGQMLWHENYVSVNYRYGENEETPEYSFERVQELLDADPLIAATYVECGVNCLDYQSCEHHGWEDSDARKVLQALIDRTNKVLSGHPKPDIGFVWGWNRADGVQEGQSTPSKLR